MVRAISAKTFCAGFAPLRHTSERCGQSIHVRSCSSYSPGMKNPSALGVDSDSTMVCMCGPP